MVDQQQQTQSDVIGTVVFYGFRERRRAARLLRSVLRDIVCCPSVVFRVDTFGRLLGVTDRLTHRIYYVKVINWCDRNHAPPVIEWTASPELWSNSLKKRGLAALTNFTSTLRMKRPMVLKLCKQDYVEAHAKTALGAS